MPIGSQLGWFEGLFLQCGTILLTFLVLPIALMQLLPLVKHTWTKQCSDFSRFLLTSPVIWDLFFFFYLEEEGTHKKQKNGRLKIIGFREEIFLAMK